MNDAHSIEIHALIDELMRYLAAVDAFRALGCEPTWQPEPNGIAPEPAVGRRTSRIDRSAH